MPFKYQIKMVYAHHTKDFEFFIIMHPKTPKAETIRIAFFPRPRAKNVKHIRAKDIMKGIVDKKHLELFLQMMEDLLFIEVKIYGRDEYFGVDGIEKKDRPKEFAFLTQWDEYVIKRNTSLKLLPDNFSKYY